MNAAVIVPSLLLAVGCATVTPQTSTGMSPPDGSSAVSTSATSPTAPSATEQTAIVIEAESMNVTDGEIVTDEKASGDKAVKLVSEKTVGTAEFSAPKGEYLVTAHVFAPDMEHDAFYLGINDTQVMRMFPRRHNQWAYSVKLLIFRAEAAGTHRLKFAISWPNKERGKMGIILDRIEIVPLAIAPSYLEKWQK
jgi:hypothetical protein